MTRAARYTVLIDRELGESDGSGVYHDGTGNAAVGQLARELQEAWDGGSVSGFFEVVSRQIVTWPEPQLTDDDSLPYTGPTHYEGESDDDRSSFAGRLRFLGVQLAEIKDEFGTGEVAISLDNALDDIDSAIRTLESDDYESEDDEDDEDDGDCVDSGCSPSGSIHHCSDYSPTGEED